MVALCYLMNNQQGWWLSFPSLAGHNFCAGNRVRWHIQKRLDPRVADDETLRTAEWSPEANGAVLSEAVNF